MRDPLLVHADRAKAFLDDARAAATPSAYARHIASAVENAVGVVESAKASARDDDAKGYIRAATRDLQHYELLRDIRIHNFHRHPIPEPARGRSGMLGPVRVSVGEEGTTAGISFGFDGRPQYHGRVDLQPEGRHTARPISYRNDEVFDQYMGLWIRQDNAVEAFLVGTPRFIARVTSYVSP